MQKTIKRLLALCCLLCLMTPALPASGLEEGKDITEQCRIEMPGGAEMREKAFDRKFKTVWQRYAMRNATISITPQKGVEQGGIYLCFEDYPEHIALYQEGKDDPIYESGPPAFAHLYLPFSGDAKLRLEFRVGKKGMGISELFVTKGSTPPDFVQVWQPTYDKADLLIVVAHPDDELLWFGGAIPYYSKTRGLKVVVSYVTCANHLRRSELLNGLWAAGVRHYPDIGTTFHDKHVRTIKELYQFWRGEDRVVSYLTARVRRFQPLVVATHDIKGEYGHPAHKVVSKDTIQAVVNAGEAGFDPESAKAYGVWDTPKLYVHLYPENSLNMAWDALIDPESGLSSMALTRLAFSKHRSQQKNYQVQDGGPFDNTSFGLYRSTVGEDVKKNDFFENITPLMLQRKAH